MPRNEFNKDEFKVRVLKLKNKLSHEKHSEGITYLAHKYLNKVLDMIDEYRLWKSLDILWETFY